MNQPNLVERPDDEELRGQGRHRQIEALDAQAGQTEDDADQRRMIPQDEVPAVSASREAQHEIVAANAPTRHEAAGPSEAVRHSR